MSKAIATNSQASIRLRAGHLGLAWALAVCSIHAQASPELAKQRNCLNCHAIDKKLVGPSFRDVAKRYAGQNGAAERLAQKIVQGGAGAWGSQPAGERRRGAGAGGLGTGDALNRQEAARRCR
jgi:cytochrome c551/c552